MASHVAGNKQEGLSLADRSSKIDSARLAFHSDQGSVDLIALLCISAAPEGGESKWVSAVAIHNELLRRGRKASFLLCTHAEH